MKSPKTKKVVKAWAVIDKVGTLRWHDVWIDHIRVALSKNALNLHHPHDKIIPCTITYSLPTKKSAGKVGKRV